jgi:hypothetical protein
MLTTWISTWTSTRQSCVWRTQQHCISYLAVILPWRAAMQCLFHQLPQTAQTTSSLSHQHRPIDGDRAAFLLALADTPVPRQVCTWARGSFWMAAGRPRELQCNCGGYLDLVPPSWPCGEQYVDEKRCHALHRSPKAACAFCTRGPAADKRA